MQQKIYHHELYIEDLWRRLEQHPGLLQQQPALLQQHPAVLQQHPALLQQHLAVLQQHPAAPSAAAPVAAASGAAAIFASPFLCFFQRSRGFRVRVGAISDITVTGIFGCLLI
ncbi:hypothetical protein ACLKA6_010473 [Drosophila palustris]